LIMNICFNLKRPLMFSTFSSSSKLAMDIPTLVFPCPFASTFVPNLSTTWHSRLRLTQQL
jgi:hypothetical protein